MSVSLVVEFKTSGLGLGAPRGMGGAAREVLANATLCLFSEV